MPDLNQDLEQLVTGSNYRFSATKIDALGAMAYTLVTIVMDASSSVQDFAAPLEQMLKTILKSCDSSDRREFLMIRLVQFSDILRELHGFKLLGAIKPDDYSGILSIGGMTALYDAMDEAIQATSTYGQQLIAKDFICNGIIFYVTDGENNRGGNRIHVKSSLMAARKAENLESLTTILVGVTNDDKNLNQYLQEVKDDCGVDQYISIGTASPGKLAKLAQFVSQSISSTSKAVGTGNASQPITSFKF